MRPLGVLGVAGAECEEAGDHQDDAEDMYEIQTARPWPTKKPSSLAQDAEQQDDEQRHGDERGEQREHAEHDATRRLDGVVGGHGANLADHALDSVGEVGGPVGIGEGVARHELEPTRRVTRG